VKILTTVKKVVDVELNINVENGAIVEDGLQYVMNAWDENAVEAAVQLKENNGAETTLVSIGSGEDKCICLRQGRVIDLDAVFDAHGIGLADHLGVVFAAADADQGGFRPIIFF